MAPSPCVRLIVSALARPVTTMASPKATVAAVHYRKYFFFLLPRIGAPGTPAPPSDQASINSASGREQLAVALLASWVIFVLTININVIKTKVNR